MNVDMIQEFTNQHKALKIFHARCNQNGAALDVRSACPDGTATLCSPYAALIMVDVRRALLKRISETEEAIVREAH